MTTSVQWNEYFKNINQNNRKQNTNLYAVNVEIQGIFQHNLKPSSSSSSMQNKQVFLFIFYLRKNFLFLPGIFMNYNAGHSRSDFLYDLSNFRSWIRYRTVSGLVGLLGIQSSDSDHLVGRLKVQLPTGDGVGA